MDKPDYKEIPQILVVDDENVIRDILSDFLAMEGYQVRTAEDGYMALRELEQHHFDLVIADLKMPNMDGIELLEKINEFKYNVLAIIMTGFGTVETAIAAMKKGAYDYILKPFKVEEVFHIVKRGLAQQRLMQENISLKETISLYKVSEAINSSISLDEKLSVILDITVHELDAEVISLVLIGTTDGKVIKQMRRASNRFDENENLGEINIPEVLAYFNKDEPVMFHGPRAMPFFSTEPTREVSSLISIPLKSRSQVMGLLNAYTFQRGYKFTEGQRKMLSVLASRAAASIENSQLYENLKSTFQETIQGFARAQEANDLYTRGHSARVTRYAGLIGKGLEMTEREIEIITQAGLLHDVGKIGISNEKLNKPQRLTAEEYKMFKTHTTMGKRILEPIQFLNHLIPAVHYHHERYDGSGYPSGLQAEDIPLMARIIAVADAYDAMTSDRAYRKALPHDEALVEIRRHAGSQFDPMVVGIFTIEIQRYRRQSLQEGRHIPT